MMIPAMASSRQQIRFLIAVGLVVVAIVGLAVMGIMALWRDRNTMDREVRAEAEGLAQRLATTWASGLPLVARAGESELAFRKRNAGIGSFRVSREAMLLELPRPYPVPSVSAPVDLESLSETNRLDWQALFSEAPSDASRALLEQSLPNLRARFAGPRHQALITMRWGDLVRDEDPRLAAACYLEASERWEGSVTPAGLPTVAIAAYKLCGLYEKNPPENVPAQAAALLNLVRILRETPSVLTSLVLKRDVPRWLAALPVALPSVEEQVGLAMERWRLDQLDRHWYRRWRSSVEEGRSTSIVGRPSWFEDDEGWALVVFTEADSDTWNYQCLPEAIVRRLDREWHSLAGDWPEYFWVDVLVDDWRVTTGAPRASPVWPPESGIGTATEGGIRVMVSVADGDALLERERRQMWWFASMLLLALVGGGMGTSMAYRAYRQQGRLYEMQGSFLSSVSHELRAPLASVRMLVEGLERGVPSGEARRKTYLKLIARECHRLTALVQNVLDFSQQTQRGREYHFEECRVSDLVRATLAPFHLRAKERAVRLVYRSKPVRCRESVQTASLDPVAWQQVIVNLVDNALKHAPPKSTVWVELNLEETETLRLRVRDQGPGVPSEERVRVWQPFVRSGVELRREVAGVGIGLSIVKHVVEGHRGTVRFDENEAEGCGVEVCWPRHPELVK